MQANAILLLARRSFTFSVLFAIFLLAGLYSSAASAATCSIVPQDPVINAGGSVNFSVNISGKWRGQKTYAWQFPGGSPSSSSQPAVTVTYATAGGYTVTFDGTSSKDGSVNCTTSVTVNGGQQCTYNPPTFSMGADQSIAPDGSAVYTLSVTNNDTASCPNTNFNLTIDSETGDTQSFILPSVLSASSVNVAPGATSTAVTLTVTGNNTGGNGDALTSTVRTSDNVNHGGQDQTDAVTTTIQVGGAGPTARGDDYATPVGTTLDVPANRLSGVLYNDFGGSGPLSAQLVSGPSNGSLSFNADGSFTYTPNAGLSDNDVDSFTYQASDGSNLSAVTTVNILILSKQVDYKIMMNYELGMHCTGFEFAYCCVLPPYNSILAQVVKPNTIDPDTNADFARLLEGDPNIGLDGLGRETVLRDFDGNGNFSKYTLRYYHDAQPRNEGQGRAQSSTLISDAEGNSLLYTNTVYDSAALDGNGALVTGTYNGATGVVLGDDCPDGSTVGCTLNDATDNYANGWLNHFYIYADLEGTIPPGVTSLESEKLRLGVSGHVEYPANSGASLQPLGPTGNGAFDNVLTFSTDTGTVVYTQMKVLENLPVMLTSPRIWEALGLPLTPFEDSVNFFGDPGAVDEDSIRPYVAMKAALHEYPSGNAVIGSNGKPVIGFGTAPIDIPNCERCHSAPALNGQGQPNVNSPTFHNPSLAANTQLEIDFWNAYYNILPGDSDWYSRLKGAAINMMTAHDLQNGTSFTANYPGLDAPPALPQNTRLGHESVICQKCHADNVIAVVKSAYTGTGDLIKPITEAIHWNHRNATEGGLIVFNDSFGRDGGCQGCHPAHRSDGVMDGYPITLDGNNFNANDDNRLASGGCFVGRDVHSNPMKDIDGAETPSHLNAVGDWLKTNVAMDTGSDRGIWCTNCHSQLGQELWRTEDCVDLINGDCNVNPRAAGSLAAVAAAVGVSEAQAISWLDPKTTDPNGDATHAIWDPAISDANVATLEANTAPNCNTAPYTTAVFNARFGVYVCVALDGDVNPDPSVRILDFCTTAECVSDAQTLLDGEGNGSIAAAVPFDAATDGRDHWLAPGEPHCADCHAAPYVEQSGNINPFPPFNYPRKASLMRYSRGHQDITCQGCHESIHGLYPVTPTIDTTSYAQAAALNHDGSHGPLKCGTCHLVNAQGVPSFIEDGITYNGQPIKENYDLAVGWAHTFTDNADPRDGFCVNCHGDNRNLIDSSDKSWAEHAFKGRSSRELMDKAEILQLGHVGGDPAFEDPLQTVCTACHGDRSNALARRGCTTKWKRHLSQGRASESVWEYVSTNVAGSTCGW